jgi:hypothetical protein
MARRSTRSTGPSSRAPQYVSPCSYRRLGRTRRPKRHRRGGLGTCKIADARSSEGRSIRPARHSARLIPPTDRCATRRTRPQSEAPRERCADSLLQDASQQSRVPSLSSARNGPDRPPVRRVPDRHLWDEHQIPKRAIAAKTYTRKSANTATGSKHAASRSCNPSGCLRAALHHTRTLDFTDDRRASGVVAQAS